MNKIGVLYSGISFQHQTLNNPTYRGRFVPIDIYDLPKIDLSLYDAIVVPRSVDQVALNDYKRVIREFLDLPGIVVALGDYRGEWLPGCKPGGFTPEDDNPLVKASDHPILNGLESPELHWHRGTNGLCSHGHLIGPDAAKALIKNSKGDTILYVDRTTTKGVILAGTQFDIFCHCFSQDQGALRAMENLLAWIDEEVALQRSQRNRRKIAVVYSGLHFHHDLFTRPEYDDMELVYIRRLARTDLSRYRVLIIPRETNQEILYAQREQIITYLESGGTVLSFGEVILPWVPGLVWHKALPEVRYPEDAAERYDRGYVQTENLVIEEPENPLFEGITIEDMRWHYHGVFVPTAGQRTLLSDGKDNAVILLDESSFAGTLLATTLDPEEHAGFGAVTITERFLERCMAWVREVTAKPIPLNDGEDET